MAKFKNRESSEEAGVNPSPMIDMVFILLIFFVVTAVFVEESGFELRTPESRELVREEELPPLGITIDEQNRIFFEKELISLHAIRPKIAHKLDLSPELDVIVRAAPLADAGWMVEVLDQVRLGGVELISLSLDSE